MAERGGQRARSAAPRLLFAILLLAGCDQGAGRIGGASLRVADCQRVGEEAVFEPFGFGFELLGAEREGEVVVYRLASSFELADRTDQLVIEIDHFSSLVDELRGSSSGQVSRVVGGGEVSVGLGLLASCEMVGAPLEGVSGIIAFTSLGAHPGERVRASFHIDFAERRSGEIVGADISGDFDFEVRGGTPYTTFAPIRP